jgi:hypothetical protein
MTKKVAMLIPSTTKFRDWKKMEDTYLYRFQKLYTQYEVVKYIGYDDDDPIYSKKEERDKIDGWWIRCQCEKGNVVSIWNHLYQHAKNKYDYYWIAGDDIKYPQKPIGMFELLGNALDKNKGLGIAGVFNGNVNLPMTQFMITDLHFRIFGYIFPPELKNWFCDNWICLVYLNNGYHYFSNLQALNAGGTPRYQPCNDEKLCQKLAKRDRRKLHVYMAQNPHDDEYKCQAPIAL